MPCKCILYPLPQTVFLSARKRLHPLTGPGRLLCVFISASRELPSIRDLSRMESRSTGMESPTPAEHQATVVLLHGEAKLCRSPGQRVQMLLLYPEPRGQAGVRVYSQAGHADSPKTMRASAGCALLPQLRGPPRADGAEQALGKSPPCCMRPSASLHAPSCTSARTIVLQQAPLFSKSSKPPQRAGVNG